MSTILIKNGLVCDGTETPVAKKDILIRGDKIVALGTLARRTTDKIIDAMGGLVIPGIIDVDTDSDHFLSVFSEPYQLDFIGQGVTTIIGGNCGSSLAPLIDGSLESIHQWGDASKLNVNWRSVKEFLNLMEERKLGLNFGTLAGYTTIRTALTMNRRQDLTRAELDSFKAILTQAFKEGAFGFSTGRAYLHYRPIPYREILELAEIVAQFKGVYAAHLRDTENDLLPAVDELFDLAKETNLNLQISHFQPLQRFADSYRQAKEMIEKESAHRRINFDCYPYETMILPIYALLPEWAQEESPETTFLHVTAGHLKSRLLEHFHRLKTENITVGYTPAPLKQLAGKPLTDFAADANLKTDEALLHLMRITRLKAMILYRNVDQALLEEFILSPQSIVSSNGASLPADEFKHERNYNTFPKFLAWAAGENRLPLEKAVAKITGLPAQKYGLANRGFIKEGYQADIGIWHDHKPSELLVNGQPVLAGGKPTKILAGRILRKTP